jgi:hypothetical protein
MKNGLGLNFQDNDFRTPKFCSTGGVFNCVAVAITPAGVGIRDTKDPSKQTLAFTPAEWTAFVNAVKNGEFDVPT